MRNKKLIVIAAVVALALVITGVILFLLPEKACEHSGGTATCTKLAVCSACGQEYGELKPHDYEAATCTEAKHCKNCSAVEGEALGHTGGEASCVAKAHLKMLYSGVRPSEVLNITEDIEHNTLTIKNSKLKSYQKEKYRTVPIFPKYASTLDSPIKGKVSVDHLGKEFKKFCPENTLKDLRHTFTTRARECGIDNELVAVWTGHSLGNITASVYTHFSMEHQQKQAKKLVYSL